MDKTILGEIRKNKYITIPELSKKTGKSEPTIYRHIEGLMKKDILKRMESRKTGYWEIIK
ncbi:MAG: winged helix-turn-helix domain-containing protein [Bacilli bacterium]|nr:winged helix-turn-helix domain-containing protein [Bacilli bacterium]